MCKGIVKQFVLTMPFISILMKGCKILWKIIVLK